MKIISVTRSVAMPVPLTTMLPYKLIGVGFTDIAAQMQSDAIAVEDAKQRLLGVGHGAVYTSAGLVTDPSEKRILGSTFQSAAETIWGDRAFELADHDEFQGIKAALSDDPRIDPAMAATLAELGEMRVGHAD